MGSDGTVDTFKERLNIYMDEEKKEMVGVRCTGAALCGSTGILQPIYFLMFLKMRPVASCVWKLYILWGREMDWNVYVVFLNGILSDDSWFALEFIHTESNDWINGWLKKISR